MGIHARRRSFARSEWHRQPRQSNSDLLKAAVNLEHRHATLSIFEWNANGARLRGAGVPLELWSGECRIFQEGQAKFQFSESLRRHSRLREYTSHQKRDWRPIMPENHSCLYTLSGDGEVTRASLESGVMRRRDFIRTGASGLAGAALAAAGCNRVSENQNARPLGNLRSATPAELQGLVGDGRRR